MPANFPTTRTILVLALLSSAIPSRASPAVTPTAGAPTSTPTIPPVAGTFQYKGCYLDNFLDGPVGVLGSLVSIAAPVAPETCSSACRSAGMAVAGVEAGFECFCARYMPYAILAPDAECNTPCITTNSTASTELCGGTNRLAVYVDSTAPALSQHTCLSSGQLQVGSANEFKFNLEAVFTQAASSTPVPLGNIVQPADATGLILETLFVLSNASQPHSYLIPTMALGIPSVLIAIEPSGNQAGLAVEPLAGGPQLFEAGTVPHVQTFPGYCALPNLLSQSSQYIGPPVLSVVVDGAWSLCPAGLIFGGNGNGTSGACRNVVLIMTPPI